MLSQHSIDRTQMFTYLWHALEWKTGSVELGWIGRYERGLKYECVRRREIYRFTESRSTETINSSRMLLARGLIVLEEHEILQQQQQQESLTPVSHCTNQSRQTKNDFSNSHSN